ncbi:WG repeat-containing protein [Mariniplasma anaerobium]|uniref:WG repeat-containing protein n=1 Tax=Mariniplasma anaerobium TaxID=2735436 RepID=A0A7U9XV71_9MOLU|nr:WG repeat-containing protein [Mariniplasma anaerobium]BCR36166.1 hypothetical protein MPAN_010590 [Mariniplasma anaerobium]
MKKVIIVIILSLILVGCSKNTEFNENNLFNSNLLAVRGDDQSWGYINESGEVVIDFTYDEASAFYKDIAVVLKDELYQLIDQKGKYVLEQGYSSLLRDTNTGLIVFEQDEIYGLMDLNGDILIEATYDYIGAFENDLALVSTDDLFGYINQDGEVAIDVTYPIARKFYNGYAVVSENGISFGVIDTNEDTIIDFVYDDISNVDSSGNVIAYTTQQLTPVFDLVNAPSQEILLNDYKFIYTNDWFAGGMLYGAIRDQYREIYDHEGNRFNQNDYTYLIIHGGYIVSAQDKNAVPTDMYQNDLREFFIFNDDGTIKASAPISESGYVRYESNHEMQYLLVIYTENNVAVYGLDKTYILEADSLYEVSDDLFITRVDGLFGAYDRDKNLVIDHEYSMLKVFDDGFIIYKKDGLYGIMNDQYEVVVDETYTNYNTNIAI